MLDPVDFDDSHHDDLVDVGDGLRAYSTITVEAGLSDLPGVRARAVLGLDHGVYVVRELMLSTDTPGVAITGEVLRQVPLRAMVHRTVASTIRVLNMADTTTPPGHERSDEETMLLSVALAYRLARLIGEAPTKYVQDSMRVSRATAARRVAQARERGYLRVDEVGKAGGAPARWER